MTIRITPLSPQRRVVTLRPTWWEWLLGRRERIVTVESHGELSGYRAWIDVDSMRIVKDDAVLEALGKP